MIHRLLIAFHLLMWFYSVSMLMVGGFFFVDNKTKKQNLIGIIAWSPFIIYWISWFVYWVVTGNGFKVIF